MKLFIKLKKQSLPEQKINCELCGTESLKDYWKYGWVTVKKRATHLCDNCVKVVS